VDVLLLLLEAGAPVNMADSMGNTAVHIAAKLGRHQILRILMQYEADTTLKNVHGRDARSVALNEDNLASRGVLHLLDTDPNFPRSFSEQQSLDAAQDPGNQNADFLWTIEEVMARPPEYQTDNQLDGVPRQQAPDDRHDGEDSNEEHWHPDLDEKVDNAIAGAFEQILGFYQTIHPSRFPPTNREPLYEFLECLIASSFALACGDIWELEPVGRAIGAAARTADDLARMFIDSLQEPNLGEAVKTLVRRGGWDILGRIDESYLYAADDDEERARKAGISPDPGSGGGSSISEDGTASTIVATTPENSPPSAFKHFVAVIDSIFSHLAQLTINTKPRGTLPGRGAPEILDMMRCAMQRLYLSTPGNHGMEDVKTGVPSFFRRSAGREHTRFLNELYRRTSASAVGDGAGENRQQQQQRRSPRRTLVLEDALIKRLLLQEHGEDMDDGDPMVQPSPRRSDRSDSSDSSIELTISKPGRRISSTGDIVLPPRQENPWTIVCI
jgi:hypothetical protein